MIKYEVHSYGNKIVKVEVERETEQSVFLPGGQRRAKRSSGAAGFYDSFQEAKDALYAYVEGVVESRRRQLELSKSRLGNIKGLKEPVE